MKATLLSLCLFIGLNASFAQTLNQLDADGKMDGKWTVYLDANGAKVKDVSQAVFYRYTWYDHGVNTQPMGWLFNKDGKIEGPASGKPGFPTILNGVYKGFDKDGKLKFIHTLKDGEYQHYEEFDKNGKTVTAFDYTKHCKDQEHSWYMYYNYDKEGRPKMAECISKGDDGKWPKMKEEKAK